MPGLSSSPRPCASVARMAAPAVTAPYKVVDNLTAAQAKDLLRRLGTVERPAYRTLERSLHWSGALKIWAEVKRRHTAYGQVHTLNLYRGCPC